MHNLWLDSNKVHNANSFLNELRNPYNIIITDIDGTLAIDWGAFGVPETFLIYNKKIFLDLKLHDIPNTVHETILGFNDCTIEMMTVHLSGGEQMLRKAMLAAQAVKTKIIGVSVLTSLNESDSLTLFNNNIGDQVINLFKLAKQTNLDGIVCSPHEVEVANTILDSHSIKITPGIRDFKVEDDQARTMNAKDAIKKGATFLVIGRPITQATDIPLALKSFNDSIYE